MKNFSIELTEYLIKSKTINTDSRELYEYGFQTLMEIFLSSMASILIALYLQMFFQGILFFLIFIPLRSYTGGFHCNKYINCFICSCFIITGCLLIVKYISLPINYILLLYTVSLFVIKRMTFVADLKRPVDNSERAYFKKKLNQILIRTSILQIILVYIKFYDFIWLVSLTMFIIMLVMILGKLKYKRERNGLEILNG